MDRENIDTLLQDSAYFRRTLIALQQSCEQAMTILAAALSQQLDGKRLGEDILKLQREAAAEEPSPTRDRILNALRERLRPPKADPQE